MSGKHHDLVDFTKKYKGELYSFFLDMANWKKFRTRYKLDWRKLPFGPASQHAIPKERGLYVFTAELAKSKMPMHGYILYVGITGDTSDANLYKRYAQYLLNHRNEDGRPAVYYMLENWKGYLYFNFVPLPNPVIDLAKLERAFINAVLPPINKRDVEASISAVKRAAF